MILCLPISRLKASICHMGLFVLKLKSGIFLLSLMFSILRHQFQDPVLHTHDEDGSLRPKQRQMIYFRNFSETNETHLEKHRQ